MRFRFLSARAPLLAIMLGVASVIAAQASTGEDGDAFYVGSHGWHTSIIIARAKIPPGAWPRGVADGIFTHYPYLEIGWGDRKFYMAPHPGVVMALDAVFLPGPSVIHLVGLEPPLARALPWSALVRVPCSHPELVRLTQALGDSFERDAKGECRPLGPGLYGTSRFYPARGRYYGLNTCDNWTIRMMRAGGLAANAGPFGTCSAGAVIAQARRLAARRLARP